MKSSLIFILFSLLCGFGQAATRTKLRDPVLLKSTLSSAEAAFGKMYFSEVEYHVPNDLKHVVEAGANLNGEERDRIRKFCADSNIPASAKSLYVARYGIGQVDLTEVLIFCKEQGVPVQITVDLNRALAVKLGKDEKFTFDFSKFEFLKDDSGKLIPMARAVQALLEAGFNYNDPRWGIYSQAVYPSDADAVKPIMHEKAVVASVVDNPAASWLSLSTANWAMGARVNRLFFFQEPALVDLYRTHLQILNEGFRDKLSIKEASAREKSLRFRLEYPDDTFIDVAFTGGKYNTNDRIQELYESASRGEIEIERTYLNEFVFTNRNVFDAMLDYFKKNEKAQLFGVFEDRYLDLDGWGLAPALGGFDIYRPFGKMVFGVGSKLIERMEVYGYQREALDPETGEVVVEKSEEGAPNSRYLMHDKTHVAKVKKDGKTFYVVHTGSFNLSNHIDNSEVQLEIWLPETSLLARAIVESIEKTARAQKQWALPMHVAVARNAIGKITGHTDLEIPVTQVPQIIQAVMQKDDDALIAALNTVAELPSRLTTRPTRELVAARIQKVKNFLSWWRALDLTDISDVYIARKFVGLSVLLTREGLDGYQAKRIIKALLWRPTRSAEEGKELDALNEARALEALKIFDIDAASAKRASAFNTSLEVATSSPKAGAPLDYFNFDWDDNILNMTQTKIILFHKSSGAERPISTTEFAKIRERIGQVGSEWQDYAVVNNPETGSFRNFRSNGKDNHILNDLKATIANESPLIWKGDSFRAFVTALSDPQRAKRVSIVTARGHSGTDFMAALEFLRQYLLRTENITIYLPPIENLYAVGAYAPEVDTAVKKWQALEKQLDTIQSQAKKTKAPLVKWGFSDDDPANLMMVREKIQKARLADLKTWDRIKLVLFYTGHTDARIHDNIQVFDPKSAEARTPHLQTTPITVSGCELKSNPTSQGSPSLVKRVMGFLKNRFKGSS